MTGYGLNPRNTAFPFGMWTLSRVVLPVLLTVAGDQEADSDRWIHYCVSSRDKATRMTCKTRKESILALAVALTVKLNRFSKWKISCLAGLAVLLFLASSPRQAYGGSGLGVDISPTSAAIHAGSSLVYTVTVNCNNCGLKVIECVRFRCGVIVKVWPRTENYRHSSMTTI